MESGVPKDEEPMVTFWMNQGNEDDDDNENDENNENTTRRRTTVCFMDEVVAKEEEVVGAIERGKVHIRIEGCPLQHACSRTTGIFEPSESGEKCTFQVVVPDSTNPSIIQLSFFCSIEDEYRLLAVEKSRTDQTEIYKTKCVPDDKTTPDDSTLFIQHSKNVETSKGKKAIHCFQSKAGENIFLGLASKARNDSTWQQQQHDEGLRTCNPPSERVLAVFKKDTVPLEINSKFRISMKSPEDM